MMLRLNFTFAVAPHDRPSAVGFCAKVHFTFAKPAPRPRGNRRGRFVASRPSEIPGFCEGRDRRFSPLFLPPRDVEGDFALRATFTFAKKDKHTAPLFSVCVFVDLCARQCSPLYAAAEHGHAGVARLLLGLAAAEAPSWRGNGGLAPLHAVRRPATCPSILRARLKRMGNVDTMHD